MRAEQAGIGSVLLVRDDDGVAHASANFCRHRGHELLPCGLSTQQRVIICPYHSWTYSLNGALRAAAGFKNKPGFEASDWGLVELPVCEWHGLVFVDGSGRAGPLADSLGVLDGPGRAVRDGAARGPRPHDYEVGGELEDPDRDYHECHHCRRSIPSCAGEPAAQRRELRRSRDRVGGWMDLRDGMATMSAGRHQPGWAAPEAGRARPAHRPVLNVFPNILLSMHPDYVMTHRLTPLAADRTRIECTGRSRRRWRTRLARSRLRGGFLGHHEPAGLARV